MKKTFIKIIILFSIIFLNISCNDPIFYIVHEETPLLKPYIQGSPANFVVFDNKLYVGSGKKIFVYSKDASSKTSWSEFDSPGGYIGCLTATSSYLYVQHDGRITRYNNIGNKSTVSLPNVQSIYAAGNNLFAGVRVGGNSGKDFEYSIFYVTEAATPTTTKIFEGTSNGYDNDYTLCGVASGGNYYICTKSKIFYTSSPSSNLSVSSSFSPHEDKDVFLRIINSGGNNIAAISGNGHLYKISGTTINNVASIDKQNSTGMLAVFYNGTTPTLLLAGRREKSFSTSGYSYGYQEIELSASGEITGTGFRDPGKNSNSSIGDNYDQYVSSWGKNPINHMFQAPSSIDTNMTLFASTQQKGVWSYRNRKGETSWNSEQKEN
jgi:hypothetical protein